jgi:hypothetical protein
MRISISLAICSLAATASADPKVTTQACLGDFDTFLTCPPNAQRSGTECRVREPQRGRGDGEHWSGSHREGPALFLRHDGTQRVSFAARYRNHKKTGRVFRFDAEGRLESWSDVDADRYHGLSVTCLPDGRVAHVGSWRNDRNLGLTRAWRTGDGTFSYAFMYGADGRAQPIELTAAQKQRPDHLCQLATCDVGAKPDLAGAP